MSQIYQKMPDGSFARLDQPLPVGYTPELMSPDKAYSLSSTFVHLSVDGSDANDGLSAEYPVKTMRRATEVASGFAGMRALRIYPGTYNIDGTSNAYQLTTGVNGYWRMFSNFYFNYFQAADPTNRPVLTGTGLMVSYEYLNCSNIDFRFGIKTYCAYLGFSNCSITFSSAFPAALWLLDRTYCYMEGTDVNMPLVSTLPPIRIYWASTIESAKNNFFNRTASSAASYMIDVWFNGLFYKYAASTLGISDASGKPLRTRDGSYLGLFEQAAPAGSLISDKTFMLN